MANQPVQQTVTQKTTIVEEEYTPPTRGISPFDYPQPQASPTSAGAKPRPRRLDFQTPPQSPNLMTFSPDSTTFSPKSPPRAVSPDLTSFDPGSPAPAEEGLVREVARILNDFQSRCDEVMANLASLPRPPGGGSPGSPGGGSPGSPGGECPGSPGGPRGNAKTNMVMPTLEDMLNLIQFGMTDYVEERFRHLNNLGQVLDRNMDAAFSLRNKLDEFETVIDNGSQFLPDFIQTWSNMAQYFRDTFEACADPEAPIPNLNIINHPSQEITQDSYRDLLWQIVIMCQQAEREVRLSEVMYSSLDEATETIRTRLEQTCNNLTYYQELRGNMHKSNQVLLKEFGEKKRNVNHFLTEWQKGGDQLNQPSPQRSPMPATPDLSPRAGPRASTPKSPQPGPSGMQQRGGAGVLRTPSPIDTSFTFSSSPGTPIEEQEERVRRLQGRAQQLEEIILRYNELQGTILHEVQNIRDQNAVLEQSMVAMQDIPEHLDST